MREILQIMEQILREDRRFLDIAAEMKSYRETVFSRSTPFTMIEARAILKTKDYGILVYNPVNGEYVGRYDELIERMEEFLERNISTSSIQKLNSFSYY